MILHVSPQFLRDTEDCAEYLAEAAGDNVVDAWRQALQKTLRLLAQFPEAGRRRHDLPQPNIRSLNLRPYSNYVIFYRLADDKLELLRIKPGMMQLPELFSEAPT